MGDPRSCTRTSTSSTTFVSDLICCPDEPHACICLQMLAPSHRAQVLFWDPRSLRGDFHGDLYGGKSESETARPARKVDLAAGLQRGRALHVGPNLQPNAAPLACMEEPHVAAIRMTSSARMQAQVLRFGDGSVLRMLLPAARCSPDRQALDYVTPYYEKAQASI